MPRLGRLREWLLESPWPLTAAVALLVALPIIVQGELSAQDARARVHADQLALTQRIAEQAAATLNDALVRIRDEVGVIGIRPVTGKPTPLITALQNNDLPAVQAQLLSLQSVLGQGVVQVTDEKGVVLVDSLAGSVGKPVGFLDPTNATTPLLISDPFKGPDLAGANRGGTAPIFPNIRVDAYLDKAWVGFGAHLRVTVSPARIATGTLQPLFGSVDELYIIGKDGQLILRKTKAFGIDDEFLRDMSASPVVMAARGKKATNFDADDPLGRGTRLVGAATLADLGWLAIAEQTIGPIEADLEAALAQQRAIRLVLIGLLLGGAYLAARGAVQVEHQRAQLIETNKQLAHASAAKSSFLASVSHELRTPMNAILGFTDALLAGVDGPLNDEQRASLGWVQRGGQDLLGLINEILDLSKIEAGKLVITPEPFDPRELLETIVAQHRSLAAAKSIRLSWRDAGLPAEIVLDRQRTRQILVNLCGNALKFTEAGEVEIVGSGAPGGRVRFEVRDTGPGIPADQIEAIFEEFRQVEGTVGGTGLGLPISRRLARLMGGDLSLTTELGQGSTFTILLPADIRIPIAPSLITGDAQRTGRLVLAIDDDRSFGPLLEKMLDGKPYRVVAPQPTEAAAEARRLRPDVITLDVLMPERGGADILRELRSDPATRDIPVIVISVMDASESPSDVQAHLTKPLRKDRLLRALEEVEHVTLKA